MKIPHHIVTGSAPLLEDIVCAVSAELPETQGATLPGDIQWMPPGVHAITAKKGGEPWEGIVTVDAAAATRVQADFLSMVAAAEAGTGDRPYFDLNHDDAEASAHPTGFYWGGDDPKTGGIRAKVEWTGPGKRAVIGKAFRRFSPAFLPDGTGSFSAPSENMGGLVNRAAFRRIAPLWAKAQAPAGEPAQPTKTKEVKTMKSLLAVLAKYGILTSSDLDEASAVAQAQQNITALQSERDTVKAKLSAIEVERDGLKTKAETATTELETVRAEHATSVVEAAITAGRIPPQNETVKAKWIALIKADPKNAELLPEPNPALAGEAVVQAKAGERPGNVVTGKEDSFVVEAKAFAKKEGIKGDETDAVVAYAAANPAAYDAYRKRLDLGKTAAN
jgi:hypothetical protein